MSTVTQECLFAGGNRHAAAADWSGDTLAYGSGRNIALWRPQDPDSRGVHTLLQGHTDTVNAVRFHNVLGESQRYIVSGAADNTIRIWRGNQDGGYDEVAEAKAHTASINTIAVSPEIGHFVSGAADGTVRLWRLSSDSGAELIQTIELKLRFLPLAVALVQLAGGNLALAVGGTTTSLHIYSGKPGALTHDATLVGHEGWIRSLEFVHETSGSDGTNGDLLLASASQDRYVRLWRFHKGSELPALKSSVGEANSLGTLGSNYTLSNKAYYIGSDADESRYSITFEALLVGHEDWIYTARWHQDPDGVATPRLLTASADSSLSIWSRDAESDLWESVVRLGEISATKGATSATGSTGGFWNGLWAPDGREVVSLSRTGSWRKWRFDEDAEIWKQDVGVSGHVKEVKAIAWSSDGSYLLSTGSDQTTRLWSPWRRNNGKRSWHEMTRPQIHGYDLNCIDTLGARQFVSGADEKLLRVFDKPKAVAKLLSTVSGSHDAGTEDLPDAANVPVLGLSNKAVTDDDNPDENGEDESMDGGAGEHAATALRASTMSLDPDHPPYEDQLARHTLWPEHEKLYGHGYEMSAVASSHDGTLIATACRASSLDHAVIRLYETKEWRAIQPPLTAHTLTVTSLQFSPDDKYLLSVGRDRQLALFRRDQHDGKKFGKTQADPKAHARMILDCGWAPAAAKRMFATVGRDKALKIWKAARVDDEAEDAAKADEFVCASTLAQPLPVTAIAFEPVVRTGSVRIAIGLQDGSISVLGCDVSSCQILSETKIEGHLRPSGPINKLAWRPVGSSDGGDGPLLAACSEDWSVRIYNVP